MNNWLGRLTGLKADPLSWVLLDPAEDVCRVGNFAHFLSA